MLIKSLIFNNFKFCLEENIRLSLYLYNNHINKAKIQIKISKFELRKLKLAFGLTIDNLHIPSKSDISLKNYKHHDAIKADLSVG